MLKLVIFYKYCTLCNFVQSGSGQVSDSDNSPTTSSMDAQTPKSEGSSGDQKNSMTLGEHITSIIMMDYSNGKPSLKNNVLSQINGSPEDSRKFWHFVGRNFGVFLSFHSFHPL